MFFTKKRSFAMYRVKMFKLPTNILLENKICQFDSGLVKNDMWFGWTSLKTISTLMDCKTNIRCWQMKLSLRPQLVSDQSHPLVPSNRAQFSLPPGKFQKETVTVFPSIHFQFFGSVVSRMAPSQYCPLASPYVLHKKIW